ncbi:MAG: DNA/RNA non-specific endonuclease [Chitinophagaceae bacterium]|nr:MAG: DNA/RNA non-specific endonuclease [Chitinophagaceae bacterium]
MAGYDANFLAGLKLSLPKLTASQKRQRAPVLSKPRTFEIQYTHFSIVQNKARKFAFYTATNIDGTTWKASVKDSLEFKKETAIAPEFQTGNELYEIHKSQTANDFDKGHITKFQDPQWGDDPTIEKAAADTMKFVNCVPQHQKLNRGAWKSLEDYIVKKFTRKTGVNGLKISVFAGPLLLKTDPFYIDKINGQPFQIPCYFWKLIVYPNKQNQLSAVSFLMSQRNLLLKSGFVVTKKKEVRKGLAVERDFFSDFTSGEPYQVSVPFLEETTGFSFGVSALQQPYTKTDATELIFKRIEVPITSRMLNRLPLIERPLNFTFNRISL